MSTWIKLSGTQVGKFILGLTGVTLKNNAGNLDVRNNADSQYADAAARAVTLVDNTSGNGVKLQASTATSANYTLTLPVDDGSPSQVLSTNGSGELSWISAASTADSWKVDTTSFSFGSASPITMFTLPANAVIDSVSVIVDTAFDGAPSLSVGVNGGSASKYVSSQDVLLSLQDRFDVPNNATAVGTTENLEISLSAGGATAGSGRVLVTYAVPA